MAAYRNFILTTLLSVYLLIAAGSIVRSTGAGMGCPDWPKCFGKWAPPTHISQLPPDYKTLFQVAGKPIADFDPFKTWVEYVNRLLGVLIGLLVFLLFVFSAVRWRRDKTSAILSFVILILTGFEGWLGSIVVATDLKPVMVTLHMFPALLIVSLLIYLYYRTRQSPADSVVYPKFKTLIILSLGLVLIQIILGTQVREAVDFVALQLGAEQRSAWIEALGIPFYIHRSFSWLLVGSGLLIGWWGLRNWQLRPFKYHITAVLVFIGLELGIGIVMAYGSIPAFLQPLHLLFALIIWGLELWIFLGLRRSI